jgi:hypothetical protein
VQALSAIAAQEGSLGASRIRSHGLAAASVVVAQHASTLLKGFKDADAAKMGGTPAAYTKATTQDGAIGDLD